MTATDGTIETLAELIRENKPVVALTGAGVSQESGIPTFRGPDPLPDGYRDKADVSTESGIPDSRSPAGIWAEFDPLEYGSLSAFHADPVKVWRFYAPRFSMLTDAEPNAAHRALAELERAGLLEAVVTQNIDLLHGRAGSRDVVEVHGSIRSSTCPRCRSGYPLADVLELLERGEGAPRCAECAAVLKPDVVFFEEMLPTEAVDRAYELAGKARLLIVVGSSLEVWPVAELPLVTLRAGGKVAVVNEGPTSIDDQATLKVEGKAGAVLAQALAYLSS